jgi:hypothetical protein
MTQPLQQVLLSCPNITSLSIDIHPPRQGMHIYGFGAEYVGFGFANGERPPPLERLQLGQYPWGNDRQKNGFPESGNEIDYWAETFDWTRLRYLSFEGVAIWPPMHLEEIPFSLALKISHKLINLSEVDFRNCTNRVRPDRPIAGFFLDLPTFLESISIPKLTVVDITEILRHGPGLRRLIIHQQDPRRETITEDDLITLRNGLPLLQFLGLDLTRNGQEWP